MRLNKKFAAIALTATVALTATAAFALWTATGSGSGAATATNSQLITGTAASGGANLDFYPGAPAVSVSGTLSNPNHFPVSFTGWNSAAVTGVSGTCAITDFTIAAASGTQTINVAAGALASPVTLPGVVAMNAGAPNACQNAIVTVSFVLAGGSQV